MLYLVVRNCITNLVTIRYISGFIEEHNLEDFLPSIRLKRKIMTRHFIFSLFYIISIVITLSFHDHIMAVFESSTVYYRKYTVAFICKELVELLLFLSFFLNLRPRDWPAYYSLTLNMPDEDEILQAENML